MRRFKAILFCLILAGLPLVGFSAEGAPNTAAAASGAGAANGTIAITTSQRTAVALKFRAVQSALGELERLLLELLD